MKRAYLDFAAAAPASPRAVRAFSAALKAYGNPSAAHEEGRAGKAILEDARKRIAQLSGAKPEAVFFTSGATEANALAIRGHVRALTAGKRTPPSIRLMYHPGAHASVVRTMQELSKEGVKAVPVPLKDGEVDVDALVGQMAPEIALISLEAVSPDTGARVDFRRIRSAIAKARPNGPRVYLHADASQLPLCESFDRTRLGADLITLDAQKVGGVRGIGCLIAAAGVPLSPLVHGGGQERGLRSGTESVALAAAFATALEETAERREDFAAHAQKARDELIEAMARALPTMLVNEGKKNVPHILNLSFPGRDTDYLAALLDERGFAVSTKSACETDSVEGSRAVLALTTDAARAASTLRISWGPDTRPADLKRLRKALIESVRFLDRNTL